MVLVENDSALVVISQLSSESCGLPFGLSTIWELETDVAAETKGDDEGVEVTIGDNSADEDPPLVFLILLEASVLLQDIPVSQLNSLFLLLVGDDVAELWHDDDSSSFIDVSVIISGPGMFNEPCISSFRTSELSHAMLGILPI